MLNEAMGELICRCKLSSFLFFSTIIALFSTKSLAIDSIKAGESINGSTQMLISPAKKFVLGIFNPQGSKFHYLGIWYNNIPQTVVWVANRDNPLVNSSAHLVFKGENIVLLNQTGWILWTSNSPRSLKEREVQLLDTGNLVLRETGSQDYAWQSFDYPSDTLLPGMKLGWDSKTGLNRKLTSWKNPNDPSSGDYTYGVEMDGLPQLVVRKGPIITFRGGPWYGKRFSGSGDLRATAIYAPKFDYNGDEHRALFSYEARNNFSVRLVLGAAGLFQQLYWVDDGEYWYPLYTLPGDGCDVYGICGEFGVCTFSLTAECDCMDGFEPKWPDDWEMFRRSGGCVRKDNRTCGNGEGFKRISSVKFPDSSGYFVNVNMSIQDCEAACLNNCSCLAYGIMELPNGGYGCVTWFHKLMDVKFVVYNGQDLYVRVAASELDSTNKKLKVAVSVSVASFLGFLGFVICFILGRRRKDRGNVITPEITAGEILAQENDVEMPIYDLTTIEAATDNFSFSNKIGEGGFGPVYKGKLPCGQEIAIKRLAGGSGQGQNEFKNEVTLISQLQHRNLVKLLGFCIHKEETLLVYEYMPNKSLDHFLFDNEKRYLLNWQKRFDIIIGISRGLLYLHRDSRLRIIHRDLKVSNILLDSEMNPKISDFGMARMFGEDQTTAKTKRVVGTYGYMSPEYALDGCFSLKSDVFSFGVILLEIVSGKKNRGFFHTDHQLNLLGHAWKLWDEGNALELMDTALENKFQPSEALRCIQIGLLCVQLSPDDRPTMWSVLSMLESENMLSYPQQPGFYTERMFSRTDKSLAEASTSNEVTVTLVHGR